MPTLSNKNLINIVNEAFNTYHGHLPELEGAIGALFAGQHFGWKVLLLIHDKKTIRKYEEILGVSFREVMPDVGPLAENSLAWRSAQKVSNFWKAVKGEIKGIRTPVID